MHQNHTNNSIIRELGSAPLTWNYWSK